MVNFAVYFTTVKEKLGGKCYLQLYRIQLQLLIPHGGFFTKILLIQKQAFPKGINREGIITSARSSINFKEYENACKIFLCFIWFGFVLSFFFFSVMMGDVEYKQTSSKNFKKIHLIIVQQFLQYKLFYTYCSLNCFPGLIMQFLIKYDAR